MAQSSDEKLPPKLAGPYVGLSTRTLITKRNDGSGPDYIRVSANRILYRRSDLDRWLAERTFKHRAAETVGITSAQTLAG